VHELLSVGLAEGIGEFSLSICLHQLIHLTAQNIRLRKHRRLLFVWYVLWVSSLNISLRLSTSTCTCKTPRPFWTRVPKWYLGGLASLNVWVAPVGCWKT
jgi:hypothetical protein